MEHSPFRSELEAALESIQRLEAENAELRERAGEVDDSGGPVQRWIALASVGVVMLGATAAIGAGATTRHMPADAAHRVSDGISMVPMHADRAVRGRHAMLFDEAFAFEQLQGVSPSCDCLAGDPLCSCLPSPDGFDTTAAASYFFDRGAALAALSAIDVSGCRDAGGPVGTGHVTITFAPSGHVDFASVDAAPFMGTNVGACIAAHFHAARVPAFRDGPMTLGKTFVLH